MSESNNIQKFKGLRKKSLISVIILKPNDCIVTQNLNTEQCMELVNKSNHANANTIKDYFISQVMFENSLKNCTCEPLGGGNLKEC